MGVMATETAVQEGKRTAQVTVDLKATPAQVWKALTDADELTRWFPLEAKVKPGVGGSILNSWGPGMQWESPITIWEPERHLRTLWCPADTPEADLFGVDFFIEDRGGGVTRLRLVHFGFAKGGHWDAMYDGVSRGWDFMTWGLKTYLEQHKGQARRMVYVQGELGTTTKEQAWARAFSDDGILPDAARGLKPGERFTAQIGGDEIRGVVRVNLPGKDFQASLDALGGSILRLQADPCKAGPGEQFSASLMVYGDHPGSVDRIRQEWVATLGGMLGKAGVVDRTK
jgi:uncharacterized protein YndB with AHSA1/START domain